MFMVCPRGAGVLIIIIMYKPLSNVINTLLDLGFGPAAGRPAGKVFKNDKLDPWL